MRTFFSRLAFAGIYFAALINFAHSAEPGNLKPATPILTPEANAAAIQKAHQQARAAEARKDVPALVKSLNDEADGELRAHRFDVAEKLRLRVLQIQEDTAGRYSLPAADALLNLGWFYSNMAKYEAAQQALDRCREIRQRLLGGDQAPVAEVLNAIGVLEDNRGNLELAEAFYRQAIAIQEKTLGLQSPVTAITWNNLATLHWVTGHYASSQALFLKALAVREKTLGPTSAAVATTLNNLALLDCSLGDYTEAEAYFLRALKIRETTFGPDHPITITTVSKLGRLYVLQGDDAKAAPLLQRAVLIQQKSSQPNDPDFARSLMQLALLDDRQKRYAEAEPLLAQALEIRRQALGTGHHEYADSLAALARHDHAQGKLEEALPLYEQALRINTEELGKNHPDSLEIATDLAFLKLELGRRGEATRLAREVIEARQTALNGVFAFAPERQRLGFEQTMQPCELPAALDDPDLMAQVILRTKGVVLDSLLEDEAIVRAASDPEVRDLMEKRRQLSVRLSQAQTDATGAVFTDAPQVVADRQKWEKEEQELEARLAAKGIGNGKTRRALGTRLEAVRAALPEDGALVEYIAYSRNVGRLKSQPAYGVALIPHTGPVKWIPLASAPGINGQVRLYQKYMRKRVREQVLTGVLQGLYQSLCQPVVASLPEGVKQLVISPDSDLNFISFATLLDAKGRFFGETYDLRYVSSGRDLLEAPGTVPARRRMVVFADPDYAHLPAEGPAAPGKGVASELLCPLPGTEREAGFLQTQAKTEGIEIEVYRGRAASKANLGRVDSPYVLHLATHGLYLTLADLPAPPPGQDGTQLLPGQPMSRSLLALAGAAVTLRAWKQGTYPPAANDGLLTAQEVAGLKLDQTWLAVLSACDTGSGEAQAGEGVLGLRRGFAEAGAQNLLMTLWTADDTGTADLMEAFYTEALRTGDAPGALARVQRARLLDLRQKAGLSEAVRKAGPFILSFRGSLSATGK